MEMNDIDALQNQFHDELHETNKSIINVTKDLDGLSSRFDAVEASNKEVNSNLNEIANKIDKQSDDIKSTNKKIDLLVKEDDNLHSEIKDINGEIDAINDKNDKINGEISLLAKAIDGHDSRIKDLENKTRETAKKVAVRAVKSATRAVEEAELGSIHDEIHKVAQAVDNLDASLSPKVESLEIYTDDLYDHVERLYVQDSSLHQDMVDMDIEHHEELHRLANAIDRLDSSVYRLYNDSSFYYGMLSEKFNELDATDEDLQEQIIDMDIEHHEELHMLAMAIDDCSTRMYNLEQWANAQPKHYVLYEDVYDSITVPENNAFYFTYEDLPII